MKKYILLVVVLLAFGFANAQNAKFGFKAGVDFATAKIFIPGSARGSLDPNTIPPDITHTTSETGVYLGALVDITASEKFHIQPEALIVFIKNSKQLQIPLLAKYYITEKFSLLTGPDLLVDLDNGAGTMTNTMGVGFDFGGSFDVTKNFSADLKYNLGITNLIKNPIDGVKMTISGLFIGVNYKL
ncbi:hypothetical protein [Flavobacterium sp.]|uniref:hypothetical protein n=1 Tax=Flavobacterium sp. TaxID=239 RepID=UPI0037AB88B1